MFNKSVKHLRKIYIDLIVFYHVLAISQPYNGGVKYTYKKIYAKTYVLLNTCLTYVKHLFNICKTRVEYMLNITYALDMNNINVNTCALFM